MLRIPITVMGYRCERCAHEWVPRCDLTVQPRVCPKCFSPYWDRPRRMTYETFRGIVKSLLTGAGHPVPWMEIRTRAGLTQMYPNNRWVHRLEQDIKLVQYRDEDGVIHWRLAKRRKSRTTLATQWGARAEPKRKFAAGMIYVP
jgi:hypothetical protein